jgi:hypothetical protein
MSTKRLSRTVLEGGRANFNKFERNQSHKTERAQTRYFLSRCLRDSEDAEEIVTPVRPKVHKAFTDKLSPVYRWLDKQVGKGWPKTYRRLKEKFDDRTLAGFHIVHQHMLDVIGTEIEEKEIDRTYNYYYIDSNNILRKSSFAGYRRRFISGSRNYLPMEEKDDLLRWVQNRHIGFVDGVLCWFAPTTAGMHAGWNERHGLVFSTWTYAYRNDDDLEFTMLGRMSKADVNHFRALPDWVRNKLIESSPMKKERVAA